MLKILKIAHVVGILTMGSALWISSTGFSEPAAKENHDTPETGGSPKTPAEPKAKGADPKVADPKAGDAATRRQAALDRMKQQLRKVSNGALRQFTGQLAQFQKVNPDIVNGIVEKLPDVNEELTKSLKDTFRESFPLLGDTADADLNRVVAELLLERFNPGDGKGDPKGDGKNDGKTDDQKVREQIDKALADLADKDKKIKDENKNALDDFNKNLGRQLDDLFKASQLAKNDDDKNKNNGLGDLPSDLGQQDAGAPPSDSGSGSGSGGGSPGGGEGKGGGDNKTAETPKKDSSDKKNDSTPLNFGDKKSATAENKPTKSEEAFSLDEPKKDTAEKPSTIKTGATQPTVPPADTSLLNPAAGPELTPRQANALTGNFTPGSPISQGGGGSFDPGGGGGGAGIQISGASASPLSSGDGDVGQGLGNAAAQPYEERGRFFYQRTGEKDWVSSGGTNDDGPAGENGGNDASPAYGRMPASTLASLGISSPRESGASDGAGGEARGVFAVGSLKKLCKSSAGATVGVCGTRAASQTATTARAVRGSLYEKARASGAIRAAF